MLITDLGYGTGAWLDLFAARSLWRINAYLGRRLDINEAGRTWAQQNKFRQDYLNGVPGAAFALPAGQSIHEQGNAIDTDDRYIDLMADHGWFRTALARNEPWHFEYDISRDNHRHEPADSGVSTPLILDEQEDEDMIICEIDFGGNGKHIVGIAKGLFAHLQSGDAPPVAADITGQDRIYQFDSGALPFLLDRYGCDLNIWDFRENGFAVLNPLDGTVKPGNTWTDVKAQRAEQRAAFSKLSSAPEVVEPPKA